VVLETNKQRVKDERRHKLGLDPAKLGVSTKLVVKRTTPNLGNPGVCKGWHYYGNYGLGKQSFERQISFSHWKVDVKKGATPIFQRHCGSLQILLSCVFFFESRGTSLVPTALPQDLFEAFSQARQEGRSAVFGQGVEDGAFPPAIYVLISSMNCSLNIVIFDSDGTNYLQHMGNHKFE